MNRTELLAQQLTEKSIQHTSIAHEAYSEALATELSIMADDSVENGDVVEYWGTDDDGNEWRVHLTGCAAETV